MSQSLDVTQEKLVGFIAAGVSQNAAALACGVSDGYISQQLDLPEVREAIALLKAATLEDTVKHDSDIFTVEKNALKAIGDKLPYIRNAMDAARIFQIVNNAKRAASLTGDGQRPESLGAQQVTFVLPKAAAIQIAFNSTNQVTEINGRSMATLPSRALPKLSAETVAIKEALHTKDATAASDRLGIVTVPTAASIGDIPKLL
jgi:hypothetical protein